jgi:hypothetical protein
MFKSIKWFFKDMVTDAGGHINSKIVLGITSFIIAVVLAFLKYPTQYPIMFLTFSGGCFGFSCFDNKSAFQFKNSETKTETITTNKDTEVKIDAAEITNKIVDKITKRGKKK